MDDTKLRVVVCYVGKDSVAGDTKLMDVVCYDKEQC